MDTTGSVLQTYLKRLRFAIDEPVDDAIYSNSDLINHFFAPAYADLWARMNLLSNGRVVLYYELDIEQGVNEYQLPPTVGRVIRISDIDQVTGMPKTDLKPRGMWHPSGPGWMVEGNTLVFRPTPVGTGTTYLWYVPNGTVQPHYASDGGLYGSSTDTFTLGTPSLGQLDKRPFAYAGQTLRIIGSTVHQERVLEAHDVANGRVTARIDFDPAPASSGVTYEIAPAVDEAMIQAMAIRSAITILAFKQSGQAQREHLRQEYQASIKTVLDNLQYLNGRSGPAFQRNTIDNRDVLWDWSVKTGRNVM